MKLRTTAAIACAAALGMATAAAQAPEPPKLPKNDSAAKAEKAASRAKTAEKAAEAARRANTAESASQSAKKAESAQKSADKAATAQKSAAKAESAQKAAQSAEKASSAAQKAAGKPVPPPEIRQPTQPKEPVKAPKVVATPPATKTVTQSAKPKTVSTQTAAPTPAAKTNAAKPAATPKLNPARQAVADATKDNPIREPSGGPDPGLAGPNKDAAAEKATTLVPEALRGQTDKNAALKGAAASLSGTATTDSPVDSRLNEDKTKRPAFDQGFADRPVVDQQEVEAATGALTNPTRGLTGGGVTGPLADSAKDSNSPTGIAQQGTGAISDAPLPKGFKQVGPKVTTEFLNDIGLPSGDFGDEFKVIKNPKTGETAGVFIDSKTGVETMFTEESFTVRVKDGKIITSGPITEEYKNYAAAVVKTANELTGGSKSTAKPPTAGQPVDETIPLKFDIVNTDTVAEQLRQATLPKGGGVIDPTRTSEDPGQTGLAGTTGGVPAVKGTLPQDSQFRNLVGTPTAPGVVNDSGGNKGLDTFDQSRGVGGIRPSDDTTVTTSGIQDKPEDALGQNLGPDQGLGSRETPPAPGLAGPSTTLAQPLPEDKTAVRDAVGQPLPPGAQPIAFGGKTAAGPAAPNLTLARPLPENKAAVARTIGPVSNVNGSEDRATLTTDGDSGTTATSGSVTAVSGTDATSSATKPATSAPTPTPAPPRTNPGRDTDPATQAGETFPGPPPPLPDPLAIVGKPEAPREPNLGEVTPRAPLQPLATPTPSNGRPTLVLPVPADKTAVPKAVGVTPVLSGTKSQ
jgi:hypothetical protein